VKREKQLTRERFDAEYHEKRPVMLRGGAANWTKLDLSAKNFVNSYGDLVVSVKDPNLLPYQSRFAPTILKMRLNEYVEVMSDLKLPLFENFPSSLTNMVRSQFDLGDLPMSRVRRTPILSLGAAGSFVGFHSHTENWLAQLQGRKVWFLVGPENERPKMRDDPCTYKDSPPENLQRKFRICTAHPGDILYIPGHWWHATCNLDPWTLAVGSQNNVDLLPEAHIAVIDGDEAKLRRIAADSGPAAFNTGSERSDSALHRAAETGNISTLALLSDLGANLQVNNSGFEDMPIHIAVEYGHLATVKWLVARGTSPNARGHSGKTPLHVAAALDMVDIVRWLLAQPGIEVDAVSRKSGRTPLHYAASNGREEIVKLLLKKSKRSQDVRDDQGLTPVELAVFREQEGTANLLGAHVEL